MIDLMWRKALLGAASLALLAVPAGADEAISFDGLYESVGVMGLRFSERARGLAGGPVVMSGFMAPPLKAESRLFVLTREPMALCPFCQTDADWPVDIVVVYLRRLAPMTGAGERVRVRGRLELGSWTDPDTGFVSQVRIMEAGLD